MSEGQWVATLILVAIFCGLAGWVKGADFAHRRTRCEDVCWPADWTMCEDDFAICWNNDRIHKTARQR